jgi:hypothetical protein
MTRRARFAACASVLCALTATQLIVVAAADAVPNDTIAQAAPLALGKVVQASNVGALTEPGDSGIPCPVPEYPRGPFTDEAGPFTHQATAWWRFRRTRRYTVVSTIGSTFDTTLVVFRRTPGGPLEVVGCDDDFGDGKPFSNVYLQRQGPGGAPLDPPGTEYFAQVGGCAVAAQKKPSPRPCGAASGTIRLRAFETLDTKIDFGFFLTCKEARVTRLRLTKLPLRARIVAEFNDHNGRYREKSARVRRRTFNALRLTGRPRLGFNDSVTLTVEGRGRLPKEFLFLAGSVRGQGSVPEAFVGCLVPGAVVTSDCGFRAPRYRDPKLKCGRGSGAQVGRSKRGR